MPDVASIAFIALMPSCLLFFLGAVSGRSDKEYEFETDDQERTDRQLETARVAKRIGRVGIAVSLVLIALRAVISLL